MELRVFSSYFLVCGWISKKKIGITILMKVTEQYVGLCYCLLLKLILYKVVLTFKS